MKKLFRPICLLLFAFVLFTILPGNALAADGPIEIEETNSFTVKQRLLSMTETDQKAADAAAEAGMEFTPPAAMVTILENGGTETAVTGESELYLLDLILNNSELRITPPEGYYVADLTLSNGDAMEPSLEPLLTKAHAWDASGGAGLSLFFGELADESYENCLDGTWLSGFGPGANYTLFISCDAIAPGVPDITYEAGNITEAGFPATTILVPDGNTFHQVEHNVLALSNEAGSVAYSLGYELDGYRLIYANGSFLDVPVGERITPYDHVSLVARWKAVSRPSFLITANSGTKEYDGTPLTDSGYSVNPDPAEYSYTLNDVVVEGSMTNLGTAENRVVSFSLMDPYGNPVTGDLLASMVDTAAGNLTVTERNLTITAVSANLTTQGEEKIASQISTQDGYYKNGYHVEGLLANHELFGDFVTGRGTESFETSINTDNLHIRATGSSEDVHTLYKVTTVPGKIEINNVGPAPTTPPTPTTAPTPTTEPTPTPTPDPKVYDVVITLKSGTWTYDGSAHHQPDYEVSGLVDGDKISRVNFRRDAVITEVGTAINEIETVDIVDKDGHGVPAGKYRVTSRAGTLKVKERSITVTAISGSLTSNGAEIVAASLKSPDGEFVSGYKVEGLASGHKLSGDFVKGSGKNGFQTWIDLGKLTVLDANNLDVTDNYSIHTVDGYITVNVNTPTQNTRVNITVSAKSGNFVYDGKAHSMEEYSVSGLVDGDKVDKVTFKSSSVITNVGTQSNEIQSVVIKSATGAAVDASKYNITYVPGKLTVTKFPLTLTAVSDNKTYDGKALNNKSVKSTALANTDHKLSADYEVYDSNGNSIKNGPVDVGVYVKKVSNVKITSGSTDVTANYEITTEDGTLTIRSASGSTNANAVTNTAYYGNTYTIRSDAPYTEFQYLLIDGQKVPAENYTVKEGSTVITLKASYIQSLKTGNHNYSIVSTSKQADGTFNVSKAPKTSDGTGSALWIILLVAAALAVLIAFFILRQAPGKSRKKPGGAGSHSSYEKRNTVKTSSRSSSPPEEIARSSAARQKKPVSDTVMDFETFFGADDHQAIKKEEDPDPTKNLMRDFRINLDDYRSANPPTASDTAAGATAAGAAVAYAATADARQQEEKKPVTVPEPLESSPAVINSPESFSKETNQGSEATESKSDESKAKTVNSSEDELPAPSKDDSTEAAAVSKPEGNSYVGRHEAGVSNSAVSSWYKPQNQSPEE